MLILFAMVGIVVLIIVALFVRLTILSWFAGDLPQHKKQSEEQDEPLR